MKVKIELDKDESIEQAEELLQKALAAKNSHDHGTEKYTSGYLNEFHDYVTGKHLRLVEDIIEEIKSEILTDANNKNPT